MQSDEIRKKFLDFFAKREHEILPSASLVPENDPSALFNSAGMQPLVPYLMGQSHPRGKRLANVQKCIRTQDIDDVGDKTHDTFFEMLGNWSLGDYFKEDAIKWSYEFLTDKSEGLGLDPARLYITCFEGDENAPKDDVSARAWENVGIPRNRIYFQSKEENWWSPGPNGPSGPDSEMFYDITPEGLGDLTHEEFVQADEEQNVIEVWNDVFMEYEKKDGKVIGKLSQRNVDTGAGLERLSVVMQGKDNIFETDLFEGVMSEARKLCDDERKTRIIADHIKTAVFILADGIVPSNTDQGYILRRLLRRAVFNTKEKNIPEEGIRAVVKTVVSKYSAVYENLKEYENFIVTEIRKEQEKFQKTLKQGVKEFERLKEGGIDGREAFVLFSTYGFPFELTKELAAERDIDIDECGFEEEMKKHQELSRAGSEKRFKGGLADTDENTIKYHTATHLLNGALREVLGNHIMQRGSNITTERLRFDFSHQDKLTDEEKSRIEEIVNKKIEENIPVERKEMSPEEAKRLGATGVFDEKYAKKVLVYKIGDFSHEICGGPHVERTGNLGEFKIKKEESVAAGIRRIKAVLI